MDSPRNSVQSCSQKFAQRIDNSKVSRDSYSRVPRRKRAKSSSIHPSRMSHRSRRLSADLQPRDNSAVGYACDRSTSRVRDKKLKWRSGSDSWPCEVSVVTGGYSWGIKWKSWLCERASGYTARGSGLPDTIPRFTYNPRPFDKYLTDGLCHILRLDPLLPPPPPRTRTDFFLSRRRLLSRVFCFHSVPRRFGIFGKELPRSEWSIR